jgi:hypothetical protein
MDNALPATMVTHYLVATVYLQLIYCHNRPVVRQPSAMVDADHVQLAICWLVTSADETREDCCLTIFIFNFSIINKY